MSAQLLAIFAGTVVLAGFTLWSVSRRLPRPRSARIL
jgi:hypothetical protein